MATSLLTTKFIIPPLRSELVIRPRLERLLDAGIHRKLTLVSAPAGFGKTTLVNSWLRGVDRKITWLSLDEEDDDLVCFLNYVVTAISQVEGVKESTLPQLLERPHLPPVKQLLTELINRISIWEEPFVLVLDDYHVVNEVAIHEVVSFLLEHQPPQMHLVIITRQDPLIPLSRLRGRSQVTEIRQRDLRFNADETADFFKSMGIQLSASDIAHLESHTEGWITGMQMAAVALQNRVAEGDIESVSRFIENFSGRHRYILDYLADEVLERQSDQVRHFLLWTSILDRMCPSLCDALVSPTAHHERIHISSRDILDHLLRINLFLVPLDDDGEWYRYHRLFSGLLRVRLQAIEPELAEDLYLRAAKWCEQQGLLNEAVDYALKICDHELAAEIIERAIPKVHSWTSVNVAVFREWLNVLPREVLQNRPRLRLFIARVFYLIGQRQDTERILQELEESLLPNTGDSNTRELLGSVMSDRASYAAVRGDVQQAIAYANRARDLLPDSLMTQMRVAINLGLAHFRGGKVHKAESEFSQAIAITQSMKLGFIAAPLYCNLAEVYIAKGKLHQAFQTCQQAMELAIVDGESTSMAGFPGLEAGKILYEQNDLHGAEKYISDSLELLGRSGTTESFGIGHAILARVKQALGDTEGALQAAQSAIQIAHDFGIQRVSTLVEAHQARIWLTQNKLNLAAGWADSYNSIGETEYLREFEDLTLARVFLAQNAFAEASALLETMRFSAETDGRLGTLIEIAVVQAISLSMQQRGKSALDCIRKAFQWAEPEDYIRIFVDEGAQMMHLLKQAVDENVSPQYATRLLEVIISAKSITSSRQVTSLVEQLSPREMEVLGLISEGLTNIQISQKLFISLPTVKSHAQNIFGKLGVRNRTAAVTKARILGILPS